MGTILDEMKAVLEDESSLQHYGMPRRSGRYPWGSGDNPYQHEEGFYARYRELKASGKSDTEIAKEMGLTTTQLRVQRSLDKNRRRNEMVQKAKMLREQGYSLNEIAKELGIKNESTVRSLLNPASEEKMNKARSVADFLKSQVDEKGMIDVGTGVERLEELGVSREKLEQALYLLELEGYHVYGGGVPQVTNPGKQTNLRVLCPPGTEHKEIYNFENIHSIADYTSHDDGETFDKFQYPESMDSSRIKVRYREDGGEEMDGLIQIRRGVADLDLGDGVHYAQVRILVDGTHYIKGMAVYSDDLPEGTDIVFNTNKSSDVPMTGPKNNTVLKPIKDDPDNPFGSYIKANGQSYYIDENGERKLSLINKRAEEGDWEAWSDHLPSQFLSKQNMDLIKKQLSLSVADKQEDLDEIMSLTNPTVRRHLLQKYAEDCDAAAIHLQAAALPRQKYQVILPVESMPDNEVYAPNYNNGEKVALIRYPHAGTFEIPVLTVNNKQKDAKKMLEGSTDAVGINGKVAKQLSGADFDGDTVMVIPVNNRVHITSKKAFEGPYKALEDFDPKLEYGGKKEGSFTVMTKKNTQKEMGVISNLITDMTLKGAKPEEIVRAVKHSMVVIDAEKHKLDYKQSEIDNGIKELKAKYQTHVDADGKVHEGGASTLISQAKSTVRVPKTVGTPRIDKNTGELIYKSVREEYTDKNGKTQIRTKTSTRMGETKDAFTLSSGTQQEDAYAAYANELKSLANKARLATIDPATRKLAWSPSAKKTYSTEVASLEAKLRLAEQNAPKERMAQTKANVTIAKKKEAFPDLSKEEIRKISNQALMKARAEVGAKRQPIEITDREWNAIQSGAISDNQLTRMLKYTDIDKLRERAMPRNEKGLSDAKVNRIKAMKTSGYSSAEIADALGVSTTTVNKYIRN